MTNWASCYATGAGLDIYNSIEAINDFVVFIAQVGVFRFSSCRIVSVSVMFIALQLV